MGAILTAVPASWADPQPASTSVEWEVCTSGSQTCMPVAGQTGGTFVVRREDSGKQVRVTEIGSDGAGATTRASSATIPVVTVAPEADPGSVPTIVGTAEEGRTLSIGSSATFTPKPAQVNRAWLRCDPSGSPCEPASGSNSGPTHQVGRCDAGKVIVLVETGLNSAGPGAPARSAPTSVVPPPEPWLRPCGGSIDKPQFVGTGDGGTMVWERADPARFRFEFAMPEAGGNRYLGPGPSYTVTPADAGGDVVSGETAFNDGGFAGANRPGRVRVTGTRPMRTYELGTLPAEDIRLGLADFTLAPGARIAKVLASGGYTYSVTPNAAGVVSVSWFFVPKGAKAVAAKARKPVLVATGKATVPRVRTTPQVKLRVRLTAAGRKALKRAGKTLKLTSRATLRPDGAKAVGRVGTFTLRR